MCHFHVFNVTVGNFKIIYMVIIFLLDSDCLVINKNLGFWVKPTWVQIQLIPLTSFATLNKLPNPSELQFLISKMGMRTWPFHLCTVIMRISVFTWVKLPIFSEQFYGPIAGALARKNSLPKSGPSDAVFWCCIQASIQRGGGSRGQRAGVEVATAIHPLPLALDPQWTDLPAELSIPL